jgi:hypothetical protein
MDTDIRPVKLRHKPGFRLATYLVCDGCGKDTFYVFQICGQEHDHLACSTCNKAFCFGGKCTDVDYE